ncbi:hypothetical protein V6Z11_D04G162400 [Gossypium hirsutum]
MGSNLSNLELFPYPVSNSVPPFLNKIQFVSYIRDSSTWTEEVMSFYHYQIDRNLFLFVKIPPERLLLLIGHELYRNHSQ